MGNDKYINYYIETLTATMTDCVIRNVSMQANAKITDEVVKEQIEKVDVLTKSNDELKQIIEELKQNINKADNETIQNLKVKVAESELNVSNLTNQLSELNTKYRDYDSVRNQATHVDTFKSELIKAREETNKTRGELEIKINSLISENNGKIEALNGQHEKNISLLIQKHETEKSAFNSKVEELVSKIEYLQLPPAKRKKIDELNKQIEPEIVTDPGELSSPIKDGGSF